MIVYKCISWYVRFSELKCTVKQQNLWIKYDWARQATDDNIGCPTRYRNPAFL